ncbi:proline-rich protein 5 isoform X1 [Gadus morhua]|uniref:proline-rich protein 5 isoform X1 n=1 Tax=Gadus morhua TaxID=8049 RepID=UPI0011B674A5|nr:proline-rich protein 5-like isoform X1 [Gadus morhua]
MEREGSFRRSLQSRLRQGSSSSSLTDLSQGGGGGVGEKGGGAPDDKGTQQRRAGANATWNSIHNAVIAVFQKKELGENELYTLNEGVRQLLKTELGSFFTEYLQNQLMTKGMVILRDKIRFYEGQKLLDSLAETWDFFFCDVLSMLQAIFYPVQGKEPSVRQLALIHFRNVITLNLKLDEALGRPRARVPPSITQMLLILQGVHEAGGVTDSYLGLEALIQKAVSPYLGTHGLFSADQGTAQQDSCCILDKHIRRRLPGGPPGAKSPVVRSQSYNVPLLPPVVEQDVDPPAGPAAVRRHSVCQMTSCLEECSAPPEPTGNATGSRTSNQTSKCASSNQLPAPEHGRPGSLSLVGSLGRQSSEATRGDDLPSDLQGPAPSPCLLPSPSPCHTGSSLGSPSSSFSSSSCCRVRLPPTPPPRLGDGGGRDLPGLLQPPTLHLQQRQRQPGCGVTHTHTHTHTHTRAHTHTSSGFFGGMGQIIFYNFCGLHH